MKVRDIMTSEVRTINYEASVKELSALFEELHISGVPVVDKNGSLVGVVSQSDLGSGVGDPPLATEEGLDAAKVADIMTEHVVTIEASEDVLKLVTIMEQDGIHRVFVTSGEELVGVVSSMDLVRLLKSMLMETAGV